MTIMKETTTLFKAKTAGGGDGYPQKMFWVRGCLLTFGPQ